MQRIRGDLTLNNCSCSLSDNNDVTGRNITINDTTVVGLAPAVIHYRNTELHISTGTGFNTGTVNGTSGSGSANMLIGMGEGGGAVNVHGTTGGGVDVFGGSGAVTVTVGSLAPVVGGTLANIGGRVLVADALPSAGTLIVDDSGDAAARAVTIDPVEDLFSPDTQITGLAPAPIVFEKTLRSVTVHGGRGGNTFIVTDSLSGPLTLNTGTGDDAVSLRRTGGPVLVNGQAGRDTVTVGGGTGTAAVRGSVDVTNAAGATALTVDDAANPSAGNAVLSVSGSDGLITGLGDPASPFRLGYRSHRAKHHESL